MPCVLRSSSNVSASVSNAASSSNDAGDELDARRTAGPRPRRATASARAPGAASCARSSKSPSPQSRRAKPSERRSPAAAGRGWPGRRSPAAASCGTGPRSRRRSTRRTAPALAAAGGRRPAATGCAGLWPHPADSPGVVGCRPVSGPDESAMSFWLPPLTSAIGPFSVSRRSEFCKSILSPASRSVRCSRSSGRPAPASTSRVARRLRLLQRRERVRAVRHADVLRCARR